MEKISILLEHKIEEFRASILGLPDCQAQDVTREDALANVQTALRSRLASAEIGTIPLEPPSLAQLTGIFKDDPQWNEFQDTIDSWQQLDEELEAEYLQVE